MKTAHDIILAPVITENSMMGVANKKYTFKVSCDANKIEISQAIESLFPGPQVANVNNMHLAGKAKRTGMNPGHRSDRKKALVPLPRGTNGL